MSKNRTLETLDAGFDIGVNVKITKRNKKTGRVLEVREGHNRCLKMQLMGIIKWLNGEFNDTQPTLLHYEWIPRYLGVGTNTASGLNPAVSSEVTINDTQLLNELSPRIQLPQRNTIINRSTQNYIQLVIVNYLPENDYNGQVIGEAGLFSQESGNNCLFRIVFDPISKEKDSVIEVNWTISVISIDAENKPYEDIDKTDLRLAMNQLLDKFTELLNNGTNVDISDINSHFQGAIYDYGRSDISQLAVDERTLQLNEDYNKLNNLNAGNLKIKFVAMSGNNEIEIINYANFKGNCFIYDLSNNLIREINEIENQELLIENLNEGTYRLESRPLGCLQTTVNNIEIQKDKTVLCDIKVYEGDVVQSDQIEIEDIVALNNEYGKEITEETNIFDLNKDNVIDMNDRNILQANYGKISNTEASGTLYDNNNIYE